MKVYVVDEGEYSDRHTTGVYDSLEAAQEANPLAPDSKWEGDEERGWEALKRGFYSWGHHDEYVYVWTEEVQSLADVRRLRAAALTAKEPS